MSILSIEKAIDLAMESIELRDDIPPGTKQCAISGLKSLKQRDYYKKWDKDKIISKIKEWTEENGRVPKSPNFNEFGMPHHATVRKHFGITPAALDKRLYPELTTTRYEPNPWGFVTNEDWICCFREQFTKHSDKIASERMYDGLRDKNTPCAGTILRHCNIANWNDLLKAAGVKYQKKKKKITASDADIKLTDSYSPTLAKVEALNQERDRHLQELYEVVTKINV